MASLVALLPSQIIVCDYHHYNHSTTEGFLTSDIQVDFLIGENCDTRPCEASRTGVASRWQQVALS